MDLQIPTREQKIEKEMALVGTNSFADILSYEQTFVGLLDKERVEITAQLKEDLEAEKRAGQMKIIHFISNNYDYLSWMEVLVEDTVEFTYNEFSLKPNRRGNINYVIHIEKGLKLLATLTHNGTHLYLKMLAELEPEYFAHDDYSIVLPDLNHKPRPQHEVLLGLSSEIKRWWGQINRSNPGIQKLNNKPVVFENTYPRSAEDS